MGRYLHRQLGFDAALASAWIDSGQAHAISFGKALIANPDLPSGISADASLTTLDPASFYGGGERGYEGPLYVLNCMPGEDTFVSAYLRRDRTNPNKIMIFER